jgi:hypothetical protein
MKEHGLYKYVVDDKIIYIGKSNNSISNRIIQHAKEPKFMPYLVKAKIYVCKLPNTTETDIMERVLINYYKPILNIVDNHVGKSNCITFKEPNWIKLCNEIPYDVKRLKAQIRKIGSAEDVEESLFDIRRKEKILKCHTHNQKFIVTYNYLLGKIAENDYEYVLSEYDGKYYYCFDVTNLSRTDNLETSVNLSSYDMKGIQCLKVKVKKTEHTYIYVENLADVKNFLTAEELTEIITGSELFKECMAV